MIDSVLRYEKWHSKRNWLYNSLLFAMICMHSVFLFWKYTAYLICTAYRKKKIECLQIMPKKIIRRLSKGDFHASRVFFFGDIQLNYCIQPVAKKRSECLQIMPKKIIRRLSEDDLQAFQFFFFGDVQPIIYSLLYKKSNCMQILSKKMICRHSGFFCNRLYIIGRISPKKRQNACKSCQRR